MDITKRQKLEAAGFKVTTIAEFLDISLEEEVKLKFDCRCVNL